MDLIIRREPIASVRPQLDALLEAHWREVAHYQDAVALEPDWTRYEALENAGKLFFIGAHQGWNLVGYSVFTISPHLHYRSHIVASNDVIYLAPSARQGLAGIELLRQSERICAEAGAHRINWHLKPEHDWNAILRRLHKGYRREETIWGRLLTEEERGL